MSRSRSYSASEITSPTPGRDEGQLAAKERRSDFWFTEVLREREALERAQAKICRLEEELACSKELVGVGPSFAPAVGERFFFPTLFFYFQLAAASLVRMQSVQRRRDAALAEISREYYGLDEPGRPTVVWRSRGGRIVVCDGETERPLGEDEDFIDSLVEPEEETGGERRTVADFECDKCGGGFSGDQHVEFLEHLERC